MPRRASAHVSGRRLMTRGESWVWHRWQLVSVAGDEDVVVVDALELGAHQSVDAALITLAFDPSHPDDGLGDLLRRWVNRDDGVCEVFHRQSEPYGCLALFQGTESVIVAMIAS